MNPERKVSQKALEVHGYTNEFLAKQKKFVEIGEEFLSFIKDKRIIIHNAEFDLGHLNNELSIFGKKKIEVNLSNLVYKKNNLFIYGFPQIKNLSKINKDNIKREYNNISGDFFIMLIKRYTMT